MEANQTVPAGGILLEGEPDSEVELLLSAWTPEEFDHFTDLGLLRGVESLD